ncbi:MAG TPA: sucrose synthase [Blastocatellia bacterium]|nr:sucrose synthase [Blastocatellia bacterium]
MSDDLIEYAREHRNVIDALMRAYFGMERPFLLQSDLRQGFEDVCQKYGDGLRASPLAQFVRELQDGSFREPWAYLAVRKRIGRWEYVRFHLESLVLEEVTVAEYLTFREHLAPSRTKAEPLEVDFGPFREGHPRLQESESIGLGVQFLNRQLSSEMFRNLKEGHARLLTFLTLHAIDGQTLLVAKSFSSVDAFRTALRQAIGLLEPLVPESPWSDVAEPMARIGFAAGWGNTVGRAMDTMNLLRDILEAPSPMSLESFLARVPMISRILILSPHGFFGQDNVLGLPDTGGQVVYILDQVRALECEMRDRLHVQGVEVEPTILVVTRLIPDAGETTCDERLERIRGCSNSWILRVPFRSDSGEVVRQWISRFDIWPFLEGFAAEVEREVVAEFRGRPDLIIGNYSDGNLVATLLSRRLGVTQCNIAHALEKTKYLLSAIYWQEHESKYHFSCQYTADLIAMNAADFIITSTYQEIAGGEYSVGQYESYQSYTMPGLYRVDAGIDVFDPRFNIVSPGADPDVYFSYADSYSRLKGLESQIEDMVYGGQRADSRGVLEDRAKTLVFTMARLDRVKNLTGLVEWFAMSERLRRVANLFIIGGHVDRNLSTDREERAEIDRMHALMDQFNLDGGVRWLSARLDRNLAGELYRTVADARGVFVQPALFEAFGLTIIEAMSSGLPTFATRYGGPREIIRDGVSGFHIDPNDGMAAANRIAEFLERASDDPSVWRQVSSSALSRVEERYTWKRYAERLMTLSRIYGFWKFTSDLDRVQTDRYLKMFYSLQFRPLANSVGGMQDHVERT